MQVRAVDDVPLVLVGNKTDLELSGGRRVSAEEGAQLARKFGCQFLETSAAHRKHVDEAFQTIVREIRRHSQVTTTTTQLTDFLPAFSYVLCR